MSVSRQLVARRRQADLSVPASSKNGLRSKKRQLLGVAHVLLLRSVANYRGSEYACVQACRVDRKRSELFKSAASSTKGDFSVLASSSWRELLGKAGATYRRHNVLVV